jgi:hypothetical protein
MKDVDLVGHAVPVKQLGAEYFAEFHHRRDFSSHTLSSCRRSKEVLSASPATDSLELLLSDYILPSTEAKRETITPIAGDSRQVGGDQQHDVIDLRAANEPCLPLNKSSAASSITSTWPASCRWAARSP